MSTVKLFALLIATTAILITSCKKDEIPKPLISDLEIGNNNNKKAAQGAELHIEATIVAEGKIKYIEIEIHPEEGQSFSYEKKFTETYEGLKNTNFHEHISIPESAETGEYHFHIKVVDMEGQSTEVDADIEIIPPAGIVNNKQNLMPAAQYGQSACLLTYYRRNCLSKTENI